MFDRTACLSAVCLLLAASAAAQGVALDLEQPHHGTLEKGASDRYIVSAGERQFVAGAADQLSVDVVVTVTGPGGVILGQFDGPAAGPEPFSFETVEAGDYLVEVAPFEQASGDYSIALQRLEPVATDGEGRVDQMMAAYSGPDTPGGSVLVVKGGEVLLEKAYGMANLVHGIPFEVATPSNLGSTSKQFTAFAILMLEKAGELSLDDDVRTYIPELPDLGETVTIRHLLTHTSGYREFLNTLRLAGRRLDRGDYIDRSEILDIVKRQPALQNEPGADWNYNNTGYGLLTVIVENVTGETFPKWLTANVFLPLGMEHSFVRADPSDLIPGSSQGYTSGAGGFMDARDLGGAMGAGGIYSTTGDLAKWIRNLQTGELGGKALVESMMTAHRLTGGESTGYGFGLFIDEQGGLVRVHHGGADSAHRAMLMTYPTLEAGVVVLSNHSGFDSQGVASKIGRAYFGDAMTATEAAPKATDSTDFNPAAFEDMAGSYALEEAPTFVLRFFNEGDVYMTQATGQPKITMTPTGAMSFKITGVDAHVTFERDADGAIHTAILDQNGKHKATRVKAEPWAPDAEALQTYVGRYFSNELEAVYTVAIEDGALVMNQRRLGDMPMTPVKAHEFTAEGGVRIVFTVPSDQPATGFTASATRARGIVFERM